MTHPNETVVPIRDDEKRATMEQQIDPWDVQAAQDEHGNVLAFDYVAISQYAYPNMCQPPMLTVLGNGPPS